MCVRVCRSGLYNVSWDDDLAASNWITCRSEELGALRGQCMSLRWMDKHKCRRHFLHAMIVAPAVLMMDVRDMIARHKPSVSVEDLEQYKRFNAEFGNQGWS